MNILREIIFLLPNLPLLTKIRLLFTLFLIFSIIFTIIYLIIYIIKYFLNKNDLNKKPIIIKKIKKSSIFLIITIVFTISIWVVSRLISMTIGVSMRMPEKPVIYFYPTQQTKVEVKLLPSDGFSVTYPEYSKGWDVTAFPDGKLINNSDNKEYSYLYWEGKSSNQNYDLSSGFVVAGKDVASFLQDKLSSLGLTPKEYNEFIVYWLPRMVNNKYNLIHFATDEEYNQKNPLTISPTPDSILRVFMVFKPLSKDISIKPQAFSLFNRQGFSVIEWGGSEIK